MATLAASITPDALITLMQPRIDTAVRCTRRRHIEREDAAQEAAAALLERRSTIGLVPEDEWMAISHVVMTRAIARADRRASGAGDDAAKLATRLLAQHDGDAGAVHRHLQGLPADGPGRRPMSPGTFAVVASLLTIADLDAEAEVLLRGVWGEQADEHAAFDRTDFLRWVWSILTEEQAQLLRAYCQFQDSETLRLMDRAGMSDLDGSRNLDMTELARVLGLGSRQTARRRLDEVLEFINAARD